MHSKNEQFQRRERDIIIILGAYNLNDFFESGRTIAIPQQIFVHPRWNPYTKNFDADLAILEPEESLIFNKYISPICLWNLQVDPTVTKGIVVGYGQSEDRTKLHENIPHHIEVPIFKISDCLFKESKLVSIFSPNMICAGSGDGRGVCKGDSGNGMIFKHQNKYFLLGIVSSSLIDDEDNCDVTKFALYTDVLKYKNWIENPSSNYEFPAHLSKTTKAVSSTWNNNFNRQTLSPAFSSIHTTTTTTLTKKLVTTTPKPMIVTTTSQSTVKPTTLIPLQVATTTSNALKTTLGPKIVSTTTRRIATTNRFASSTIAPSKTTDTPAQFFSKKEESERDLETCKDGLQIIHSNLVCDGKYDCTDKSDEIICGY